MSAPTARVLVAIPAGEDRLAALHKTFPGTTFDVVPPFPPGTTLPPALLAGRDVLVSGFTPANFDALDALRWIQLSSAGYTQLAGLPLRARGIRVSNASGVNDIPIAEWCLLMMLAAVRDLPGLQQVQRDRAWRRDARFQAELRGHRAGIIGYGNIGREVARLCRAHGLEVWAMNRRPIGPTPRKYVPAGTGDPAGMLPHRCFTLDQMDDFLPGLDYLIVTAALNDQTRGLLGARELRLLPPHAVVLNPARAHLIAEAAFGQALREGWIAGAALDSHYREPLPPDDPTWDLPNLVITPHISGSDASPRYGDRMWEIVAANLARHLAGEPLLNEIAWDDLNVT